MRRSQNLLTQASGHEYVEVVGGGLYTTNVPHRWKAYYGTEGDRVDISSGWPYLSVGENVGTFLMVPKASAAVKAAHPGGRYWLYNDSTDLASVSDPYLVRGAFRDYDDGLTSGYWYGKKWLVIGDSISDVTQYAAHGYPFYVASKLGLEVSIAAISGRELYRISAVDDNYPILQARHQAEDYDLVTIAMGTNDFVYGGTSIDEMYGRLEEAFSAVWANQPGVILGYITPTDRGLAADMTGGNVTYTEGAMIYSGVPSVAGQTRQETAAELLQDYCRNVGVPCVNVAGTWHSERLPERFGLSHYTEDGYYHLSAYDATHPTDWAHAHIFAPKIARFVAQMDPTFSYDDVTDWSTPHGYETVYTITNQLDGCTTDNEMTEIPATANRAITRVDTPTYHEPNSYYARLTPTGAGTISAIRVTVGGVDVTAQVVSGNEILIKGYAGQLTGNIVVTASVSGDLPDDPDDPDEPPVDPDEPDEPDDPVVPDPPPGPGPGEGGVTMWRANMTTAQVTALYNRHGAYFREVWRRDGTILVLWSEEPDDDTSAVLGRAVLGIMILGKAG